MRHRIACIAVGVLLAASVSCGSHPGVESVAAELPDGWVVVPALVEPESWRGRCANLGLDEWQVGLSTDSSRLLVHPYEYSVLTDELVLPSGRLLAEDRGEFGGNLWFEPDSSVRVSLLAENIHAFLPLHSGIYAMGGLAHLGSDEGHLYRLTEHAPGQWRVEPVLDLGSAPLAAAVLGGDSILVVQSQVLELIQLPSSRQVLHRNDAWKAVYPNSVIRDRAGVIYIGMRSGVARLRPSGDHYVEEWLIRSNKLTAAPPSCGER